MTIHRRSRALVHVAATLALASLAGLSGGCGGDQGSGDGDDAATGAGGSSGSGDPTSSGPSGGEKGVTWMRLVHASADAPAVDVYAKGSDEPLIEALSYGSASDYLELPPGAYALELRASPSTASDPVAYATDTIDMADGDRVTAVAAGLLASSADSDKFRVLPLLEGFVPPGSGNAIVRVVHGGADAPSVGLDLGNDDPSSPEVTGLDRFTDTGAAGIPLTADRAANIGITAGGARVTAFTTPELPEGAELFVIATGLTQRLARESDGFALLAVGPDGAIGFIKQDPQVYALHASPDAPEVDAFAGEAELVDGISFGELAGPLQVPPGSYALDFFGHVDGSARPDGAPAATATTGTLAPGERYLAIATGFLGGAGGSKFQLVALAEGFALDDANNGRVRLVHASPDAPAVDLGVLNAENVVAPVLAAGVAFGNASEAIGLTTSPGTVPIGVAPAGNTSTVVASFHVPVTAGMRAFGIAAGALDPASGESFRLLAVETGSTPWAVATIHPQPQQ
jgi:hypothetical protein